MKKFPNPDDSEFTWVGHLQHQGPSTEEIDYLITHCNQIEILGGYKDPPEECIHNEIVLCFIVNEVTGELEYYTITSTDWSSVSCPELHKTWDIEYGPCTLQELREWVKNDLRADVLLPLLTDEVLEWYMNDSKTERCPDTLPSLPEV